MERSRLLKQSSAVLSCPVLCSSNERKGPANLRLGKDNFFSKTEEHIQNEAEVRARK